MSETKEPIPVVFFSDEHRVLEDAVYKGSLRAYIAIERIKGESLSVCEYIFSMLSDLPIASRSPEERWNEIHGWIVDEILPKLESVINMTNTND